MNARNLAYIRPYNFRNAIRLADNKLRSKEALFNAGIPVPKIYGIVRNRRELEVFKWADLPKSFVLKPNHGIGGEGIKIIYGQKKDLSWVSTEGKKITIKDIQNHIMNIFDGFYSLSGISDIAFFEERIKISKTFKPYSYRGIPDIRIIVFNKVPVMAMLRLPTKESGGKANLHLGGIGVGIDVATGTTTNAVLYDEVIEKTPDTNLTLSGIKIPYWKRILEIAIKCQEVSKLGYIGVDVAVDRDIGPVVLEINARSGLSIQIANLAPLKYRLKKVKGLKVKSESHGIRIAQDLFGGEIEQEIEEISGKQILGIIETIKIKGKNKEIELKAKIDTGADLCSIDKNLAKKIGYNEIINEFDSVVQKLRIDRNSTKAVLDEKIKDKLKKWGGDFDTAIVKSSYGVSYRLIIKMNTILSGIEILSKMSVTDRSHLEFPVIIGRQSLKKFLVDPSKSHFILSKEKTLSLPENSKQRNIDEIIEAIAEAERNISPRNWQAGEKIVRYAQRIDETAGKFNDVFFFINPFGREGRSYSTEMSAFLKRVKEKDYNPTFEYPNLSNFEIKKLESVLDKLSSIYKEVNYESNEHIKRIIREAIILIKNKINFLISVKQKNESRSFEFAKRIYGDISYELTEKAENVYKKMLDRKREENSKYVKKLREKTFDSQEIENKFREALYAMELYNWDVVSEKEAGQIDVKFSSLKYNKPTIVIPRKRKLNGINLIKRIIHEIVHIKTNTNNRELGFGGVIFGRDYELYQEGIAKIIESDFMNNILETKKELSNPYYIIAMNKIKNGYSYHKLFDHLYKLKMEEYKTGSVYGKDEIEKISQRESLLICRRVFRGFRKSLSSGRYYFPKDKIYFEGEILAKKMWDNGFENYLIAAKIDPYLIPSFITAGVINKTKVKYNLDNDLEIYRKLFLKF